MKIQLKFKSLIMHILLLAVCAVSVFVSVLGSKLTTSDLYVVIPNTSSETWWSLICGALLVLFVSMVILINSIQGVVLRQNVVLPSLIYAISVSRLLPSYGVDDTLLSALSLAFMLYATEIAVVKQNDNGPVFWVGLMAVTASLFAPKMVVIAPLSILLLATMGRFTLKDISALFVGWVAALVFAGTTAYACGTLEPITERWRAVLFSCPEIGFDSVGEWGRLALIIVTVLILTVVAVTKFSSQIYTTRRIMGIYIMVMVSLLLSALIFGGVGYNMWYVMSVPVATVLAYTYVNTGSRVVKLILYLYLLANIWPSNL